MSTLIQTTQQACNALINANIAADNAEGPNTDNAMAALAQRLQSIYSTKGYTWLASNLIGVRMDDIFTDAFTDYGMITVDNKLYAFPISTKPGSYYLAKPETAAGCACLLEGQYTGMWEFNDVTGGWSGDPYMQQAANCNIIRQLGKTVGSSINRSVAPSPGVFGINFHSWKNFNGAKVYNLSAGCQVMDEVVLLDEIHDLIKQNLPGKVTYTLLHKSDFELSA